MWTVELCGSPDHTNSVVAQIIRFMWFSLQLLRLQNSSESSSNVAEGENGGSGTTTWQNGGMQNGGMSGNMDTNSSASAGPAWADR